MLCTLLSGLSLTAFADDTYYTVTYSVPTGYLGPDADRVLAGHSYTLPTGMAAPEGYDFVGWYENPLQNEIALVDPGDSIKTGLYLPTGDTTLYACYHRTENIAGYYEKTTGEPASSSNKYLIVYEGPKSKTDSTYITVAFTNKPGTAGSAASHYNTAGDFINVTIANNQIALTSDVEAIALTIRRVSTGHFSVKLPNGKYIGYNSGTDLKLYDTEYTNNGIDFDALGYFVWNDLTTTDRVFSYSIQYEAIKFYKDGSNLYLYERHAPRTVDYYTTNPLHESTCSHVYASEVTTAATCTAAGVMTYTCTLCGDSYTSAIPALGHDYVGVVTAPSAANSYVGYTTYTCSRCGDSYVDDYTGQDFQITYSVQGTTTTATVNSYTGTTLPATATAADGYTFEGWSEQAIATESASAAILSGEYHPSANVTLYAVYSRDVANSGSGAYVKVASGDPIATNGKYLFVSEPDGGAIAFNAGADPLNAAQNYFAVTLSGNTVTGSNNENLDDAAVTAIRIAGTSYYGLQIPSGKYMGTTGSTGIATRNDAYPLSFSYDQDGYIEVQNTEGTTLLFRFNHGARSDKFGFYGLTTSTCDPVSLYYKDGSGSYTYYTTDPTGSTPPPSACDHNFVDNQCTICGEKFYIHGATVILNNQIDVVYITKLPSDFTNVSLTVNGTAITEYTVKSGYYYFYYTGVNPQCMGDNLSAVLAGTAANGQTYTALKESYSVREYCISKLSNSSTSAKVRSLVTALLIYGTRAQQYMSYNTSAYVTSGSDFTGNNPSVTPFTALSGYSASFDGDADPDTYWLSAGLTLSNGVAMNFRFYSASINGLTATVKLNGETKTYSSDDFVAVGTNLYEITFDGISPNEFADNVMAYFEYDAAQVGNTVSYSVNAYIQSKQNDSNNKLKYLVQALSVYGRCAEAYLAN